MRKSFILHIDSLGILDELSDEQCGQLFRLIANYHNPEKPNATQITQVVNLAFYSFKNQFDRDFQAYQKTVERNKNNGLLGGRPKKNNPKKPDSKNDSDSKNDNVKDNNNNIPTISEFLDYCKTIKEINYTQYEFSLKTKYETWVDAKWVDGNGKKIKNWKTKIKSVIPYLKPTEPIKPENKSIYSNYPKI